MRFYPDIKAHISPSALASWHDSHGAFVRSYFVGEKTPDTSAMRAGKKIHALAEAGLLNVIHRFEHHEVTLTVGLPVEGVTYKVLGIPDSYGRDRDPQVPGEYLDEAEFVDYKSGKENTWDAARLASDLKMKTTAFLVWENTGHPGKVIGYIEYIPTQWNPITKEIEPTGEPSVEAGMITYTFDEMVAFAEFIKKTIDEVNTGYEEWLASTDEFINQDDVAQYAQLDQEVKEREAKMADLLERIADQMKLGGKESIPSVFGSFYFSSKKTYERIPADYPVKVGGEGGQTVVWEFAEEVALGASAAKTKFQTDNEPISVSKSLTFRAKKAKK